MKALILNMRDAVIVKEFETMEEAEAAQDSEEFAGFPKHLVERDNWDLSAVDLCRFYNVLAPETPIKNFTSKKSGMLRLLAALDGHVTPVTDEKLEKSANRKAADDVADQFTSITNQKDFSDMSKAKKVAKSKQVKVPAKKATKAPKTERAARTPKDFTVTVTKDGKAEDLRMNKESIRSLILAKIKAVTSIEVAALEKKLPDLQRPAIVGAIQYMVKKGYVKIS